MRLCGQLFANNYCRARRLSAAISTVSAPQRCLSTISSTSASSRSSTSCRHRVESDVRPLQLSSTLSSTTLRNSCRFLSSNSGKIVTFNLADIGEGISEVVIKEWFVKEGDKVAQFDAICEVQSDKASVTITSRYDGFVHKIYYGVDDMANVGKPLVDIRLEGGATEAGSAVEASASSNAASASAAEEHRPQVQSPKFDDDFASSKILTTPAVRRLAMEHKINLKDVSGTGKEGRILKEDVLNYIAMSETGQSVPKSPIQQQQQQQQQQQDRAQQVASQPQAPIPAVVRNKALPADRTEPIKGITKSMFKTMTNSLSIPHFGLSDEIDMSALVELKPELKRMGAERGFSVSFMPFMIKAASIALTDFPILNAQIDKTGDNIVYKGSHNIGVAMDTKQGLLVPNIKGVNGLSVIEIAQELNRLQQIGKNGQLGTAELSGGTFTLSNIGSIGGLFGIPVLMPSEVAIGAIGKTVQVPRFVDSTSDAIRRAHIVHVLWSADHRIIDGATMTRFNNRYKSLLENPMQILLS